MITFAFYLFAISVCVAGFMVVLSRNPVHSVLWLILAFIASAGLFVLQGAEFVAMLLVIVYVGAVAVLFLFVVMMLDVDFAELRRGNRSPTRSSQTMMLAGVCSAGFSTTQLPAASAGASFHTAISSGKFHGMIWPTTPSGSWK